MSGTSSANVAPTKLDLPNLKTVRWVESQEVVKKVYNIASQQYKKVRDLAIFSWMFSVIELCFVWNLKFIHALPWPQFALNLLHNADTTTEWALESLQQRLEWVSAQIQSKGLPWFSDLRQKLGIDNILARMKNK